jgi:2-iminobutanoate/2-iminopropanoate deaminase
MTALARRSITLEGYRHGDQPIPAASRLGPLLMTGGVHGTDRATGTVPDDLAAQVGNMFANLGAIVAAGGGTLDDVVKVTVFTAGAEVRALVNAAWVAAFPDPASRPARHSRTVPSLPGNIRVQCAATAFIWREEVSAPG